MGVLFALGGKEVGSFGELTHGKNSEPSSTVDVI